MKKKIIIGLVLILIGFMAGFGALKSSEEKKAKSVFAFDNTSIQGTAFLSPSLLDEEAEAKTNWFANIIPEARAADPFDELTNRKLSVYGGVITVVNGNENATHALEIGQVPVADNDSIGLASTGELYVVPNEKDLYAAARFIGWTDTGGDGRDRVYLSLTDDLKIQEAGVGDVMSIGNSGRDIRSTGNIYIRPNDSTAISSFIGVSGQRAQNLFLSEGTGVNTGGATLRVNNNLASANYGRDTDAIFAAAENDDGAAISALQTGAGYAAEFTHGDGGYAGKFSGKVNIEGNLDIGTDSPRQICWNNVCYGNWSELPTGAGADDDWTIADPNIYTALGGNVGIGQSNPASKLTINVGTDNVGSATDAVHISHLGADYSDSALYVQQDYFGSNGPAYAGYFSGRVKISGNTADGYPALVVDSRDQYDNPKDAAYFYGNTSISGNNVDITGDLKLQAWGEDGLGNPYKKSSALTLTENIYNHNDSCGNICVNEYGRHCLFGIDVDSGMNIGMVFSCTYLANTTTSIDYCVCWSDSLP